MKKITETIAETILLASLVALFAIPVIVFGGFSPTSQKTTVNNLTTVNKKVLGAKTSTNEVEYSTEILATNLEDISIEETNKTEDSYEMSIRAYNSNSEDLNKDLIRITNTSDLEQTVVFNLSKYYSKEQLESVKLKLDNSSFVLSQFIENEGFQPALTLQPNEWVTIGIIVSEDLKTPTTFSINAEIYSK